MVPEPQQRAAELDNWDKVNAEDFTGFYNKVVNMRSIGYFTKKQNLHQRIAKVMSGEQAGKMLTY